MQFGSQSRVVINQLVKLKFNRILTRRIVKAANAFSVERNIEMSFFRDVVRVKPNWCCDEEDINGKAYMIVNIWYDFMKMR